MSRLRLSLGGEAIMRVDPPEVRRLNGEHVTLRRFRPADEATVWEGRSSAEPTALPTGPGRRSQLRNRMLASGQWGRGPRAPATGPHGGLVGHVRDRMGAG